MRAAARTGRRGCLALLAVLDLLRFGSGASDAIGWLGFLPAWGVPWLLGAWWRTAAPGKERRVGAGLVASAVVAGWLLVARLGYEPALIDAVVGRRSNTTPPTLFTAVAALGQVGVLLVVARVFDRVGGAVRPLLRRARAVAVGVYLWHLTALALLLSGWWLLPAPAAPPARPPEGTSTDRPPRG